PNMEKSHSWVVPVCLAIGLTAFGVTRFLLPDDKKDEAAVPALPLAAADDGQGQGADKNGLEVKKDAPPAAKNDRPPQAAAPARGQATILRRLTVSTEANPDKWGHSPFDVHDLAINENGTRLITKSKMEVVCWDLTTGKRLQTYLPPAPAWEYM